MFIRKRHLTLAALPFLLGGCFASLDGSGSENEATSSERSKSEPEQRHGLVDLDALDCEGVEAEPGPSPLRLLSREQYLNTVEDLVGIPAGLEQILPTYREPSSLGASQAHLNANDVEAFSRAAVLIAKHASETPDFLERIAPCSAEQEPTDCAETFVRSFGARAYRSPVTDDEDLAAHLLLFTAGNETSYARGIELLLTGVLQSPRFLYQVEVGTSEHVTSNAVKRRPHEVAARLAYLIWNRPPDTALLEAAEGGELESPDQVEARIATMIADPRGAHFVYGFLEDWTHVRRVLGLAKREDIYPAWSELREATYAQATAFFQHIVHERNGSLTELLTSKTVMLNGVLAPYYEQHAGQSFELFEFPNSDRAGLLTLPALLATQSKPGESSPIHRGLFVREALLCQHPPAPPAEIPAAPEVDSGGSTRERLAQHVSDPGCAGCHNLLDPIGLGLEHFDAIGMYRATDNDQPVDASGELTATDVDSPFTGASELGALLAQSQMVEQCVTRQWFRFALMRSETDADLCSLKSVLDEFRAHDTSLNALPRALAHTNAFLYRRPSDAEITP